jgi:nucleoside permease NupC
MGTFSALIGFIAILLIAYLLSTNRKAIRWRTVGGGWCCSWPSPYSC